MRIKSYNDCETIWATRKRKLANNTYLTQPEPGRYAIRLHDTDVVTYVPHRTILRTGGWLTTTTKDRINEFSPAQVWQEKGEWWVRCGTVAIPFQDGMEIEPDGSVIRHNPADPADRKQLRKRILAYATGYANALLAGEVPAPSAGDCWPCALRDQQGKPWGDQDQSHLLSHLDEGYYVPSLLHNAMTEAGSWMSTWDRNILAGLWSGHVAEAQQHLRIGGDLTKRRFRKVVANYILRRFQMVPAR